MYIFPGLGLGCILSKVSKVTDGMVEAASIGLANSLTEEEKALDLVYPRIERIREISAEIARSVIRAAQQDVSIYFFSSSSSPPLSSSFVGFI